MTNNNDNNINNQEEQTRKRKALQEQQETESYPNKHIVVYPHVSNFELALSLTNNNSELNNIQSLVSQQQLQPPQTSPPQPLALDAVISSNTAPNRPGLSSRPLRVRRNPTRASHEGRSMTKSETIPVPYPWATDRRAMVHSMEYLLSKGIRTITNRVKCKKCDRDYNIDYDLQEKFTEVATFLLRNQPHMHERAPERWMNPILPTCKFCGQENSCKPVLSDKKKSIDWLFLLLGQLLGCCTLDQLKYFCKHTKNHRTGAKDRVLYLAYLALSKQLDPNGPFDYHAN